MLLEEKACREDQDCLGKDEKMAIPSLHSEHYRLRGLREEDAVSLFPFMGDGGTMKYITPHPVQNIEEMRKQVGAYLTAYEEKREIPWVIEDRSGDVIGFFRFHKLHHWHRKAEMGVVISAGYQRSGVMSELMAVILRYGFEELQLNRIVGDIFAENQGSRKLLERYGFQEEGTLRQTDFDGKRFQDTVVFSMLREEYQVLNKRLTNKEE